MYFEDFKASVAHWLCNRPEFQLSQPQAAGLRQLYGKMVVPDKLCNWLSNSWQPQALGQVDECACFLLSQLFHVDSHPTLTRFFTFRSCIDRLLSMVLLGINDTALSLKTTARKDSQTRLRKVKKFLASADGGQALRRSNLVMQLTGPIEAFMSKKHNLPGPRLQ